MGGGQPPALSHPGRRRGRAAAGLDRWVLVPRTLARFDPELAWTLDYEDAPEPEDADPRLDFSGGALLVPVERWNDHAALEPNLAPCRLAAPLAAALDTPPTSSVSAVA